MSAALVSLPVLFLLSALGCLFELYSNTHMDALSVGLGLRGPLRIIVSLSLFLLGSAAAPAQRVLAGQRPGFLVEYSGLNRHAVRTELA